MVVVLRGESPALTLRGSQRYFVNKGEQLEKNPIKFKLKLPTVCDLL